MTYSAQYDGDGNLVYSYEYDFELNSDGKIVELISTSYQNGQPYVSVSSYDYDANGNMIMTQSSDAEGNVYYRTETEYITIELQIDWVDKSEIFNHEY